MLLTLHTVTNDDDIINDDDVIAGRLNDSGSVVQFC